MVCAERFVLCATQPQTLLQPECPVYIHCSRRCMDQKSGAVFVQVRMVNRSERLVCSVFLRIEGLDGDGKPCYVMPEVVLADCNAMPHTVFGENRLLLLERTEVDRLRIVVERVGFADGMLWRRLPSHRLTSAQEAGWERCVCAMWNPSKTSKCALCGRRLTQPEELLTPPEPIRPQLFEERPAPIVRPFVPIQPAVLPEERAGGSSGLLALLIVLATLAVLSVVGMGIYAYLNGLI